MPPLIEDGDITIDAAPGVTLPRGFLRARHVGETAGTADYGHVLAAIRASVDAHLAALGIASDSGVPRHKMGARHLARHYAAEAVLANADVGSDRDQTGASSTLSASDLAHWERMRDNALAAAEKLLGTLDAGARSAVYFPTVGLSVSDDATS